MSSFRLKSKLARSTGFLPGIFSAKIYCFVNFYCYAKFSIVFRPDFKGAKVSGGELPQGGAPTPSYGRKPVVS